MSALDAGGGKTRNTRNAACIAVDTFISLSNNALGIWTQEGSSLNIPANRSLSRNTWATIGAKSKATCQAFLKPLAFPSAVSSFNLRIMNRSASRHRTGINWIAHNPIWKNS